MTRQENLSLREQIVNLREQAIEAKVIGQQSSYTCRWMCLKTKGRKIIEHPQDPLVFLVKLIISVGFKGSPFHHVREAHIFWVD